MYSAFSDCLAERLNRKLAIKKDGAEGEALYLEASGLRDAFHRTKKGCISPLSGSISQLPRGFIGQVGSGAVLYKSIDLDLAYLQVIFFYAKAQQLHFHISQKENAPGCYKKCRVFIGP